MGAALTLFILMSLSIFIVRVASVALRHTGLEEGTAKFQALSAISSTGFTTKEAEMVVNYPVRRRGRCDLRSIHLAVGRTCFALVLDPEQAGGAPHVRNDRSFFGIHHGTWQTALSSFVAGW
jgi:hypothetical protein